jgi:hypothetical protein
VDLSGGLEQEQKGGKLKAMFQHGAKCMPKQGQRKQTEKQNNTDTDPDIYRREMKRGKEENYGI